MIWANTCEVCRREPDTALKPVLVLAMLHSTYHLLWWSSASRTITTETKLPIPSLFVVKFYYILNTSLCPGVSKCTQKAWLLKTGISGLFKMGNPQTWKSYSAQVILWTWVEMCLLLFKCKLHGDSRIKHVAKDNLSQDSTTAVQL